MSPSLRWWPSWWWSLHLRSFRCRLLDGSHYTRPTYVVQIEPTQTTPKPLQTLAFVGVSQPHDSDTKTADATATAAPRHGHTQGRHGHVTTVMSRDVTTSRARRPRHGHDEHGRDRAQRTDGHGGHDHSHSHGTDLEDVAGRRLVPGGHARPCTTDADATRPRSCTVISPAITAYKGTCTRDTTRHAKTQSHKRSNVAPCNKYPRGGVSPRRKKQGRWLSSADAECSLEHFWITRYLRSLHIFSGCNRFCTLHIVYNVPWIDVDGGRAQLGSASISGCYHSLRVA